MKYDDSLLHVYDPAKAREYYLRTRELTGRKKGSAEPVPKGRSPKATVTKLTPKQRQEATKAKVAKLKKRLERLKAALAELVAAAKKRSGVETPSGKDSKGGDTKSTSNMTAKQKREASARSKDYYEKNKDKVQTPDQELKALQAKIKDIRAKIKAAIAEAKKKPAKNTGPKTASKGR